MTRESIERLKSSFRLEDFLRHYVELKRSGDHFAGKCPFHADDSPSFAVYPDHYYCYGCKAQGDAFSFLESRDGLRFPEAVEAVASRIGFALDYEAEKELSPEQERRERERRDALHVVGEAAEFFHKVLLSPVGQRALEYLGARGYSADHIKQYRLGLSLERDALVEEARRRGWNLSILERLSLIQPSKHGAGHYDFFRDRIIIPIHDERANVVAFGGRIYLPQPPNPDFKAPKYLNSKESDLFSKGATVFNFHRARGEIARSGQALLVEGFFDCLTLSANGVENVVAALSTSITPQHLDKLHMLARARELVVSFDADRAGQDATLKFFAKVFPTGRFVLRSLSVPDGKDPDEFIRAKGKAAFVSLLECARPLLDQVCEIACTAIGPGDVERRLQAVREKILPAVTEHPDPAMRDLSLQTIASFLKLSDHRYLLPTVSSLTSSSHAGGAPMGASGSRVPVGRAGSGQGAGFRPADLVKSRGPAPVVAHDGSWPPAPAAPGEGGASEFTRPIAGGARRAPLNAPQGTLRARGHAEGLGQNQSQARAQAQKPTSGSAMTPMAARVAAVVPTSSTPAGPQWRASPAEIKFVCSLLHAERADLPTRLRTLFEGSEVVDPVEGLRMEVCGETLTAQLTDDSKELVRDILHVQYALGGRSVLQLHSLGEGADVSRNLRVVVALAQDDEGCLEALGMPGLLASLASPPMGASPGPRARKVPGNAYVPPLSATLRLALSDAEFSSRQGTLRSGLERQLVALEREHLQARWRVESKRLMALGAESEERLRGEEELRNVAAALALVGEGALSKKLGDDLGGIR